MTPPQWLVFEPPPPTPWQYPNNLLSIVLKSFYHLQFFFLDRPFGSSPSSSQKLIFHILSLSFV